MNWRTLGDHGTVLIDTKQASSLSCWAAYTDGAWDLGKYKSRRADIEHNVEGARRRLTGLDAEPVQEPAAPVVRGFADMWPTVSVDVRRDVGALLLPLDAAGQGAPRSGPVMSARRPATRSPSLREPVRSAVPLCCGGRT